MKKVQQPVLPAIDENFAKSLGITDGDLDKMRKEVRTNLEREVSTRLKARTKDNAMSALLASTRFDVPKSLVEEDKQRLADMARRDLAARGVKAEEAPLPLELFSAQAERRVRLGLLVGELVRANGLQPKPDQIRKLVEELAQSYERPAGRRELVPLGSQATWRVRRHRAGRQCDALGAGSRQGRRYAGRVR